MIEIIPNWHPILVHFTVALLSVAAILSTAVLFFSGESLKAQWHTVAQWNLWFGAVFVVLTVLSGIYAYNTVAHDTPSHLVMTDHRNMALITAILFLGLTVWSVKRARAGMTIGGALTAALLFGLMMLGTTAWLGGELVYRHGLGVMSLPKVENHAHKTGEEHSHDTPVSSAGDSHDDGKLKLEDGHHDNSDGHHDQKKAKTSNDNVHVHEDGREHLH